jgi:prepilin-type processing-associated H-X9-DG protein
MALGNTVQADYAVNECIFWRGNPNTGNFPDNMESLPLDRLNDPSRTFMKIDSAGSPYVLNLSQLQDSTGFVAPRHNGGQSCNMLLGDGHSETRGFPDEMLDVATNDEDYYKLY